VRTVLRPVPRELVGSVGPPVFPGVCCDMR
jgi:hypothetical protein